MKDQKLFSILSRIVKVLIGVLFVMLLLIGIVYIGSIFPMQKGLSPTTSKESDPVASINKGIHTDTGLLDGEGLNVVIMNCTSCHSAKMITQNRATKDGWRSMIRWMQETQNLWDLGGNEEIILNYLSTHYAPEKKGRRTRLSEIEWYELE